MTTDLSHGRGWLDAGAAASLRRIDAELGHPLDINEAGRSWAQQNVFYRAWLNGTGSYALSPDAPSIHQLGEAIDTDEQNTPVLNRHGWFHTVFWADGSLREAWHYEYDAARDQHINDQQITAPKITEEDDMKYLYVDDDGNGKPIFVLVNTRTAKFITTKNTKAANGWATVWGNAIPTKRQEFLNMLDAIQKTT